jgi:hypothetical protein
VSRRDVQQRVKRFRPSALALRLIFAVLTLLGAALAFGITVHLFNTSRHPKPEPAAASFTRVGGATRVETSVEAARFWRSPPGRVVEIPAYADQNLFHRAADCARRFDSPLLLYPSTNMKRRDLVDATITSWSPRPQVVRPDKSGALECPRGTKSLKPAPVSIFDVRTEPTRRSANVAESLGLASFVVFAAAKSPGESPDIAIGRVLAAHLAREERGGVSLVIVPRYPETDPGAVDLLRRQKQLVEGGVIVGEPGILSEDSGTLLRQVLVSPPHSAVLSAFNAVLGSFLALLGATAAFFGLKAVTPVATEFGQKFLVLHANTNGAEGRNGGTAVDDSLLSDLKKRKVLIWLRSGRIVRGTLEKSSRSGLRLIGAIVAGRGYEPDAEAKTVLVQIEDVSLVALDPPDVLIKSPIRHASLRLVSQILADFTGELSQLDEQPLAQALREARDIAVPKILSSQDLDPLVDEARAAGDLELHTALRGLQDGYQLMRKRPKDVVARKVLFDALEDVIGVSVRKVSWSALASSERPASTVPRRRPRL